MSINHNELVKKNKSTTLTSWMKQNAWHPLSMVRANGIYFWDADDKRYLDWSSQLINVNIGHTHTHVVETIQEQASRLSHAFPGIAIEPRARLGELLHEIVPVSHGKSFFTLGGADAVESAMMMARLVVIVGAIVCRGRRCRRQGEAEGDAERAD